MVVGALWMTWITWIVDDRLDVERATGFEPATLGLGSRCSTAELHPRSAENIGERTGPRQAQPVRPNSRSSLACASSGA